ncbi:MAG TPA: carboxypeptidase-like regulatory domain-containing protein, partial [Thermoanaerobaculia bacterium]
GCAGLPTENDFRFGRLTGRVTDATTGAAVAGARVTLQDFTVTSNADGRYELTALSTGRHLLVATAAGYAEYRAELRIDEGDQIHNISLRRP